MKMDGGFRGMRQMNTVGCEGAIIRNGSRMIHPLHPPYLGNENE